MPNIQTVRNLFDLFSQKVQLLNELVSSRGTSLAAEISRNADLASANKAQAALVASLNVMLAEKTGESLNLAMQIASLSEQYGASESARSYAATQVDALNAQLEEKKAEIERAAAAAAELASAEVAEDTQQAEADATLQSQIADLETEITSLTSEIVDE